MTARFILSLDCEGRWGVADQLTPEMRGKLSDERLRSAYDGILTLLDEMRIPATFAFVGCFSLSREALVECLPALVEQSERVPGYLDEALDDLSSSRFDGWVGDWAMKQTLRADVTHEVGLHGATHVPWDWPGMTEDVARAELQLLRDVHAPVLSHARTFIYPRNAVAHRSTLTEFGLIGSRDARVHRSRIGSLLTEFNPLSPPDRDPSPATPVVVPAGRFVNWHHGARRLVPATVTRLRARTMLRRADRSGRVVHYWLHPENVAVAPRTLDVLRGILDEVGQMRDDGRCLVLTQRDYCDGVKGS